MIFAADGDVRPRTDYGLPRGELMAGKKKRTGEETAYEYDVFISYSSKDKAWVRGELLKGLEKAELKVCIDCRDFTPGKAALFNMQDAVRKSRKTLLVISSNWFKSEWTFYESLLSHTKNPAGLQARTFLCSSKNANTLMTQILLGF